MNYAIYLLTNRGWVGVTLISCDSAINCGLSLCTLVLIL